TCIFSFQTGGTPSAIDMNLEANLVCLGYRHGEISVANLSDTISQGKYAELFKNSNSRGLVNEIQMDEHKVVASHSGLSPVTLWTRNKVTNVWAISQLQLDGNTDQHWSNTWYDQNLLLATSGWSGGSLLLNTFFIPPELQNETTEWNLSARKT